MSHVKVSPCFMFFYVLIFVAVEIFWHIGGMERIPMTVDQFIDGLEDGLFDLALVLKQGRAKCKTFITNEYFNENETRIQQGQTNCSHYFVINCILMVILPFCGASGIFQRKSP